MVHISNEIILAKYKKQLESVGVHTTFEYGKYCFIDLNNTTLNDPTNKETQESQKFIDYLEAPAVRPLLQTTFGITF